MIGKLTGRVDYVAADHALIETGGVGYIVHCAPGTLGAMPGPGEVAALYTAMIVREDLHQLLGFRTVAEREWHRLLISVQGVGAKVALAIVDALGPDGVSRALALSDANAVRSVPGVGPKLANRIVNELADKAAAVMALGAQSHRTAAAGPASALSDASTPTNVGAAPGATAAEAPAPPELGADRAAMADALSALVNLGYERGEAARAVAAAEGADAEALIRAALRALAPAT